MSFLTLHVVQFSDAQADIAQVRQTVFQQEQGVDPALEFDGQDDAATHILAYWGNLPIGTARIRYLSPNLAKIERVAVLAAYRGQGIGKHLMETAIAILKKRNIAEIKINSQRQAEAFYEKLGFTRQGDEFEEAGIPHVEMRYTFNPAGDSSRDLV